MSINEIEKAFEAKGTCDVCGKEIPYLELADTDDDYCVCPHCLENETITCTNCGDVFLKKNSTVHGGLDDWDEWCCNLCLEEDEDWWEDDEDEDDDWDDEEEED